MTSETTPRILGILLAAGRGRRMNGAKQFEPFPTDRGSQPLVVAAFEAVQPVCDAMLVVLGHRADEVATLLADRSYHRVDADPDSPMFASVRSGLQAARDMDARASVLLQPGDHPEVARATLHAIMESSRDHRELAIMPEHRRKGGHPVLIPPPVVERVLAAQCPDGLRQFWADHPELSLRIKVDDASTTRDVDYPL